MKSHRILGRRGAAFVVLLIVFLLFLYGPLFAWSPIKPGYSKLHLSRADVIYPAGTVLPEAFRNIDSYIDQSERFHRLPIRSRVTVILCRNWKDAGRFYPSPDTGHYAGKTIPTSVIFISPIVMEEGIDYGEIIRHELSHATLNQNQSLFSKWQMERQQWFAEGLAVSFGNQKAFITSEQFLAIGHAQELQPLFDPDQSNAPTRRFNLRVRYQTWRYFLEYLIQTQGRSAFQRFMVAYMAKPTDYRNAFEKTYGRTLSQAIQEFQASVREDRWKPNPAFAQDQETASN